MTPYIWYGSDTLVYMMIMNHTKFNMVWYLSYTRTKCVLLVSVIHVMCVVRTCVTCAVYCCAVPLYHCTCTPLCGICYALQSKPGRRSDEEWAHWMDVLSCVSWHAMHDEGEACMMHGRISHTEDYHHHIISWVMRVIVWWSLASTVVVVVAWHDTNSVWTKQCDLATCACITIT